MRLLGKVTLILLFMLIVAVPVNAQAVASPNPAQIGQTVTITNTSGDPSHRLLNCRIEGQGSYGDIPAGQSVNFTIPQNAQPGSSYTFACDGYVSSSSEFPSPVNPILIGVIAAPPSDADGDGIPDGQDQCPNQPAPNSNNGCPPPQQPPPASNTGIDTDGDTVPDNADLCPATPGLPEWNGCPDADGDGLTTQYDNCPNQPGPRENLGCPNQAQPAPTQPPPAPAFVLPALPNDGSCYVATTSATPVNIRADASTDTGIVGQLAPRLIYPVAGVVINDDDQRWFSLADGGYVAAFVVRSTSACDGLLPATDAQTVSLDIADAFADCPDLLDAAAEIPPFVLFEAADSADPCAALEAALNDLLFGTKVSLSLATSAALERMINDCTLRAALTLPLLDTASEETDTPIEPAVRDLACGTPFAYNGFALLDLSRLIGTSDRDRIVNGDLTPAEAAVRAVIEGECGLVWEPFGQEILLYLLSITETDAELLGTMSDICDYIDLMINGPGYNDWFTPSINPITINQQRIRNGNLTDDERRLRDALAEQCGIQWQPYGQYLFLSSLPNDTLIPDLSAILNLLDSDPDAFCDRMWSLLPGGDQLRGEPESTPPEVERIARGDLTPDEAMLRDQLETICGLYWEPYGRAALMQLSALDSISLALTALATSPQNACLEIYALLGLPGEPPPPSRTADQQATTDRIGRGDLTGAEEDLRTFMETACGIAWEPAGREIMLYLLNHGGYDSDSVRDLIGVIRVDGEPDTDILNLVGSDESTGPLPVAEACDRLLRLTADYLRLYGTADSIDPYDDDTAAYMAKKMRDRIERGDLSSAESQLRDELVETCGFSWELVARELLVRLALAGEVDAALANAASDSDAFCAEMLQRAQSFTPLLRTLNIGSLPLFALANGTATEQRIAISGDYTPSETALRGIIEQRCDIRWDDGGFNLLVNIVANDAVQEALQRFNTAPDDFCTQISESTGLYADILTRTANLELDPRTPTERRLAEGGRLTLDELRLRGILGISCGIPWDPYGVQLLGAYIDADTVQEMIDAFNADPVAFCEARVGEAIAMGMTPPEERTIERDDDIEPRELSDPLPEATATPDGELRPLTGEGDTPEADLTEMQAILRNLLRDCGITGAAAEELILTIGDAGLTADAIAVQAVNPAAFCDEMRRLVSASEPLPAPPAGDSESAGDSADTASTDAATVDFPRDLPETFELLFETLDTSPAVFQIEDNGIQRLVLLDADGRFIPIPGDLPGDGLLPAVSPDNGRVAFIQNLPDEPRQLALLDFSSRVNPQLQILPVPGTLVESRPVWLSEDRLLISLLDNDGQQQIWIIDADTAAGANASLWMTDASAPSIDQRQRNVAFVRMIDGIPNVFTAALSGGIAHPITQDANGCEAPRFGADPFVLYYVCNQSLYRYGVGGSVPLVDEVSVYAPAPVPGFVMYSDGEQLYLLDEATGAITPFASSTAIIRSFDWTR